MTNSSKPSKLNERNILISSAVALIVAMVGYLLVSSRAAGFFASLNASNTSISGNAVLVADTGTVDGKAILFGSTPNTPPTPPTGALKGWQLTTANVGLAAHGLNCDSLAVYTGSSKPAAGTTISQKRVETTLDLTNGNITIEKSCIRPKTAEWGFPTVAGAFLHGEPNGPAKGPITIRDSEIDGSALGSIENQARVDAFKGLGNLQRNYIHHVGSGIAILLSGKDLSAVIEGNYVTQLKSYGNGATTGTHSDGFTIRGFSVAGNSSRTLSVTNNRFNCDGGNESGAFFIQTWEDNIGNVTAQGNLLEGGGYQLVLNQAFGNTYTNMKAIDNRMTKTGYGASSVQGGTGWSVWSNNYVNDPSKADNKGAAVSP